MRLRDGTYVITGAASGIGRACSRLLSARGRDLVLVDRDGAMLAQAASDLEGSEPLVRELDVTDAEGVAGLAADLEGRPVVGLVNAAGIVQLGSITEIPDADWNRVLDVNLKGTYLVSRAFIPLLADSEGGSIVNLASIGGRTKSTFSSPSYVASKAGVIGLTMALAAQHADQRLRVNCVAPGVVETPMLAGYSQEQRRIIRDSIPLKRFAESEEIASAIAFLLSDDASYITGQTINVNGGQFMQ